MGRDPDLAVLVVSPTIGVGLMATELVGVAAALQIPLAVIVSKCDTCPQELVDATLRGVAEICTAAGLGPMLAVDDADCAAAAVAALMGGTATPVICASSVTGVGIKAVRALIGAVGVNMAGAGGFADERSATVGKAPTLHTPATSLEVAAPLLADTFFEMQVQDVFAVTDAGPIVGGVVRTGAVGIGDRLELGPLDDGSFCNVAVVRVHRNGEPCRHARAHETATIELAGAVPADVRQGQVLVSSGRAVATTSLTASVRLLPLCKGELEADSLQAVVIRGGMKRAVVMSAAAPITAGSDTVATVTFDLRPECMRAGDTFLFRANRRGFTGYGVVTAVTQAAPVAKAALHLARSV